MGQIHKKKKKKKILGFEPATFCVVGKSSPDWAMEAVSVPPENKLYIAKQLQFSTAKNKHNLVVCVWKDKEYSIVWKEL